MRRYISAQVLVYKVLSALVVIDAAVAWKLEQ
jgi:hypothetical protein